MTELTYLFATLAVLTGVMTSISIWAPRQLRLKLGALGAAVLFLPAAYASFLHLLSMPKPVALEWWHAKAAEATVLASTLIEGEGIYLWLQLSGAAEPRAYLLPWNRDLAEQLQRAPGARPSRTTRRSGCACRSSPRSTTANPSSTPCRSRPCRPRTRTRRRRSCSSGRSEGRSTRSDRPGSPRLHEGRMPRQRPAHRAGGGRDGPPYLASRAWIR